jgi:hypothetical protein
MVSAIQEHDFDKETDEKYRRHRGQSQAHAQVIFALLWRRHA